MQKRINLDIRRDGTPVVCEGIELTSIRAAAFKAMATMECETTGGLTLARTTTVTVLILMVVTEAGATVATCDLSELRGHR